MRDDCVKAITEAAEGIGRRLSANDLRNIETNLLKSVRSDNKTNRTAQAAMTPGEQIAAAAQKVSADLVEKANKNVRNIANTILAHDRNQRYIDAKAQQGVRRIDAVRQLLTNWSRNGTASLEQTRTGISNFFKGKMQPIADATQRYAGFWADRGMIRDVIREGYGEKTGNATAKKVWDAWRGDIAEPLRKQANEAGSDIGELDYGYVPQSHSQYKLALNNNGTGTMDWVNFVMQRLDRSRYLNDDGSRMADTKLQAILAQVHNTIASDGASSKTPQERAKSFMQRGGDNRFLHFKDADSYMDYNAKYGDQSFLETLNGHIDNMSRNIAAMKTFGPHAEAGFNALLDEAAKADARATGNNVDKARGQAQKDYDIATGNVGAAADPKTAHKFQIARTMTAMVHLGGATLSAITDGANIQAIARSWNIPAFRGWAKWESKAWMSQEYRQFMRSQGVGVEGIVHGISRFNEETFGHGTVGALANAQFRVSGLNAIDNIRRTAGGGMLYSHIGHLLGEHADFEGMGAKYNAELKASGTDQRMWDVWRQADIDPEYGITPSAIANIPDEGLKQYGNPESVRNEAMQHLVGTVARSVDTIVPMMTDRTRARVEKAMGSPQRGTVGGELTRSVLQFKSFPLAMVSNHWQRMMAQPSGASKAMYGAEVIATSAILGAVSIQLKSLVAGNNPQDMTDPKFTARAIAQGGAFGLIGDLTLGAWGSPYKENLTDQMGPLAGTLADAYAQARDVMSRDPNRKENIGGNVARLIQRNTPFGNLWYAKAAIQHLIFQRVQDYFSPGYADRMQKRMQTYYNSGQWWKPSTANNVPAPDMPNLKQAVGTK